MAILLRLGQKRQQLHLKKCSVKLIGMAAILLAVIYLTILSSLSFPSPKIVPNGDEETAASDSTPGNSRPSSPRGNDIVDVPPPKKSSSSSSSSVSSPGPVVPSFATSVTNPPPPSSSQHVSMRDVDHNNGPITIGVASTVTGCGTDPYVDGAAVLKYSLDVHRTGRYDYKLYMLYHPSAAECVLPLASLGFTLLERPTPINVDEIRGDGGLRERIVKTGCCGEKELIKLEAYTLVDHPVVIHLDLDAIILQPMDDVIDFMLNPTSYQTGGENEDKRDRLPLMWPQKDIPNDISLIFTKDYNIVPPRRADKPYQGGFFMIKPSMETYEEFRQIVLEGNYDVKKGWGGKVGPFHGGMTIQGLLPWYYEYLHPGRAVELNRCIYNNMSDKPKLERENGTERCRTNEDECEDCRYRPAKDVVTFHYTICQKPWHCLAYNTERPDHALCREMAHEWFLYRSRLEVSWGRSGRGEGTYQPDRYMGYCTARGGYLPIETPYGDVVADEISGV